MRINTKIRYGLRAMICLTNCDTPDGVMQKTIAEDQGLSNKYLDAIVAALKSKGLITTYRGKGSGYKLTRPASLITMYDIYTAFEPIHMVECLNNPDFCNRVCECHANTYWAELKKDFIKLLKAKTLEQIAKEDKVHSKTISN